MGLFLFNFSRNGVLSNDIDLGMESPDMSFKNITKSGFDFSPVSAVKQCGHDLALVLEVFDEHFVGIEVRLEFGVVFGPNEHDIPAEKRLH